MAFEFMQSLVTDNIDDENNSDSEQESDVDYDFELLNIDLDEFSDSRSNDHDTNGDQESRSTTEPEPGSWSTVFTPIEVEEFTEYQGLKVDLTENSHPRDYFDLFSPPELISKLSTKSQPQMTTVSRHSKSGPIPTDIHKPVESYNKFMTGVDLADQYRASYPVGRASHKWWRYIFYFLLQISIINSFLLMKKNVPRAKRNSPARSHIHFRLEICRSLLRKDHKRKATPEIPSVLAAKSPKPEPRKCDRLPGRHRACHQCSKEMRKTPAGRTPETVYGCATCNIRLCKGQCFSKFHNIQ